MKQNFILVLVLVGILLVSCSAPVEETTADGEPIVVFSSIVPQQYFVDRIGGEYVTSIAMVEPGASPATYEPKPSQMVALSGAQIYFSIGVAFENAWIGKIADANPSMKVVDTTVGIEKRMMDEPHTHEGEEETAVQVAEGSGEGVFDPHVWLSPTLVKIQAQNIYAALVEIAPEHEAAFSQNLSAFLADIDELDQNMKTTMAGVTDTKFMVFHPSWGYFADEFGLTMIAIEVGGTEPSAAELAALIDEAKHEGIQIVFVQPQFSTQDASTIANEIGGEVILIDPLAYDWLDNMQSVADTFAAVLK